MMVKVSKKNKESESPAVKKAGKNLILKKKEGKVCFFRGRRFNIEKPKFAKHERGVVYIKHIPHGFFEEQILNYFKQFGRVTAYNLPRAKTGRIKGYAFIEFEHPEVAKIAAETMNNYLMFDRLLKAEYIPPENQKPQKFGLAIRDKARKTTLQDVANKAKCIDKTTKNRFLTKEEESKLLKRHKQKIDNLHQKLSQFGIDYEFQVANEPVTLTKVTAIPEDKEQIIIEVDESDDEISFKTPPNAIKQPVKKSKERILLLGNKENEKNKKKEGKEKVKKSKKFTKTIGEGLNPVIAEEEKSPSTSKKSLDNFSGKPSKKIKTKVSDKNMKNETKVEHSVKSDKNGGILKKFKKSDTTKNKKKKSKILGVMKKSKQKSTIVEPKKLKKKLKGLNLAGVKHMMNTFM